MYDVKVIEFEFICIDDFLDLFLESWRLVCFLVEMMIIGVEVMMVVFWGWVVDLYLVPTQPAEMVVRGQSGGG